MVAAEDLAEVTCLKPLDLQATISEVVAVEVAMVAVVVEEVGEVVVLDLEVEEAEEEGMVERETNMTNLDRIYTKSNGI